MAHFSDMRQRGPSKEPQNLRILDGRSTLSGSLFLKCVWLKGTFKQEPLLRRT
jgi:hypothetical protein